MASPVLTLRGSANVEDNYLDITNGGVRNWGGYALAFASPKSATSYPTRPGTAADNQAHAVPIFRVKTSSLPDVNRIISTTFSARLVDPGGPLPQPTYAYLVRLSDANAAWTPGTSTNAIEVGASCHAWLAYDTVAWAGGIGAGADSNLWIANAGFTAPSVTDPLGDPTTDPPSVDLSTLGAGSPLVTWTVPRTWVVGWATGSNPGVAIRIWKSANLNELQWRTTETATGDSDMPTWTLTLTGWDDAGPGIARSSAARRRRT